MTKVLHYAHLPEIQWSEHDRRLQVARSEIIVHQLYDEVVHYIGRLVLKYPISEPVPLDNSGTFVRSSTASVSTLALLDALVGHHELRARSSGVLGPEEWAEYTQDVEYFDQRWFERVANVTDTEVNPLLIQTATGIIECGKFDAPTQLLYGGINLQLQTQ